MEHVLEINKLGPIDYCKIECKNFMTITGMQASGKSTIAKVVYYFRTIKDDILRLAEEQALYSGQPEEEQITNLRYALESFLRDKFMRVFGSSWGMDNDMCIQYWFSDTSFVKIILKDDIYQDIPNYIWTEYSSDIWQFLNQKNGVLLADKSDTFDVQRQSLKKELAELFNDTYSVVFIPAGRSMLTLFSQQLNFIYTTMKESQKRLLDYCTQDYIERILRLKPEFSNGLNGLTMVGSNRKKLSRRVRRLAEDLIKKILRGRYCFNYGEERIELDNGRYTKINFSSSGQQESVWILNLLFYYLVTSEPVLFIIEEPESHLFPESQKFMTDLIALVSNSENSVLMTTHSPYVLGALNNLLFPQTLDEEKHIEANTIIPQPLWIRNQDFNAWFVSGGRVESCMDSELPMIQNEKIDEISNVINDEFDRLLDLQQSD